MTRTRFSYKRAINWNMLVINVKEYENYKLTEEFKPITTGDWIKYYRLKNG
ncbi:hypothetical protein [Clostridium cavendishii]|uniref:hypothetical protein n=1 Tax=Clostridium cavendishii TaxID=349931 RepID=UPI00135630BB|nr:hypothetical protein [Clostridium cavendishii]